MRAANKVDFSWVGSDPDAPGRVPQTRKFSNQAGPKLGQRYATRQSELSLLGPGGCRIAPFNQFFDARAAIGGGQRPVLLDAGGFLGEILILDGLAKPARIGALVEVIEPGPVIDAGGQLHEGAEVVGSQIECTVRTAKIEAGVLAKLALGILADMALPLVLGLARLDEDCFAVVAPQNQNVSRLRWCHDRDLTALGRLAEFLQRWSRAFADAHEHRHHGQSEEHTSELQSLRHLVCRLLLE